MVYFQVLLNEKELKFRLQWKLKETIQFFLSICHDKMKRYRKGLKLFV